MFTKSVCIFTKKQLQMSGIVGYSSSSESNSETETKNETKASTRLPNLLVNVNKQQSGEAANAEDDPELHDGRIRTIKHERGNWATFIYTPVPAEELIEIIQNKILGFLANKFEPDLEFKKIISSSVHVSLTKLLILRHHWIDVFVEKVAQKVEDIKR